MRPQNKERAMDDEERVKYGVFVFPPNEETPSLLVERLLELVILGVFTTFLSRKRELVISSLKASP